MAPDEIDLVRRLFSGRVTIFVPPAAATAGEPT